MGAEATHPPLNMLGPTSERRLTLVHPTLAFLIHQLAEQMSEPIGVTQGLRNAKTQAALYAQGRQSLDSVNSLRAIAGMSPLDVDENISPVTDAKPGYSWHEFGLAVDVVPLETSGVPDWNVSHPTWAEIIELGEALGMTSGISWHDEPHLQLTGRFPEVPTDEVRQLFASGGLQAVWNAAAIAA